MRVILASGSPRRKELLKQLVADFEVLPAKGSEIYTEQKWNRLLLGRRKKRCW